MNSFQAPSAMLLRAFLKPSSCTSCQVRMASGYTPRSRYTKPTGLDKLHRRQKKAIRAEKQASIDRAVTMVLPESPQISPQEASITSALPFTINRTTMANIPVYETSKAGGNKHITQIRRLSGDLDVLAAELRKALNLAENYTDGKGRKKENVMINRLTRHVTVRGWRGAEVKKWVATLGF